ncbi:hypothetical protein GCM10027612_74910 [Microbispora bryophytorum subsp. camponoti]
MNEQVNEQVNEQPGEQLSEQHGEQLGELRRELCDYGRRAAALGLVIGTSGNLSVREGDLVVVTPSGVALDRLRPEDCPVVDLGGRVVEGSARPPRRRRCISRCTRRPEPGRWCTRTRSSRPWSPRP